MRILKSKIILFVIGGLGYGALEILWRGRTHWSMLGAGGISFVFFADIGNRLQKKCLMIKAIVGSCFITTVEFVLGIIFNVILKRNVWDYSKVPLNLLGQICLPFSVLWTILSLIFIPLATKISKKLLKNFDSEVS